MGRRRGRLRRDGGVEGGRLTEDGDRHEELLRRYLEEIGGIPALSADEEAAFARAAAGGDAEAGEQLVRSNLALVVAIARRYAATGVPLLDLIQEGNLGLMAAVEAFDADRGFSFRTFATWFIRRGITQGIAESGGQAGFLARTEAEELESRLQEAWDAFVSTHRRQPTMADLAAAVGVPEARVADVLASAPPPDPDDAGDPGEGPVH